MTKLGYWAMAMRRTLTGLPDVRRPEASAAAQEREEHRIGAVEVGPQLHVRSVAESGQLVTRRVPEERTGIDELDVVALLQHVGDDEAGLVEVGAARGVGDEPAGRGGLDRGREQLALEPGECRDVVGRAPPAG